MNTLPTEPSRYIAFLTSYANPKKQFWYVIENGTYATYAISRFDDILPVWRNDPPTTVYDILEEKFVPLVLGA